MRPEQSDVKVETYLSKYVTEISAIDNIDTYQMMRAAGQVETLLGLGAHTPSMT
jgi:hypothetical protein